MFSKCILATVLALLIAQGAIGSSIQRRVISTDNSGKNLIGNQGSQYEQAIESDAGLKPESELRSGISGGDTDSQDRETVPEENLVSTISADRKPKTLFHHVLKTVNTAESELTKLLSLIFKHTSGPAYRKETSNGQEIQAPAFLKPLANIPHFLTTHPINFKKLLPSLQHNIGKRSVEQEKGDQFQVQSGENPGVHQGRTLHRIIPNFEANFNRLFQPFRTLFPTNQAQQSQYQNNANDNVYEETSKSPAYPYIRQGNGPIGFTNLMRMLPEIFNRRIADSSNQGQQPQNLLTGGLQRLMAMLRRPIFPSQQTQQNYSS